MLNTYNKGVHEGCIAICTEKEGISVNGIKLSKI